MEKRRRSRPVWLFVVTALSLVAGSVLAADGDQPAAGVVNVNTATLEQLQILPGIGEAKAKAIVQAREQRGGFKSLDELVEVKGIGPSALEKLRTRAVLRGATTAREP